MYFIVLLPDTYQMMYYTNTMFLVALDLQHVIIISSVFPGETHCSR